MDSLTKITLGIAHALHNAVVLVPNGWVALEEVEELNFEVEAAGLPVPEKLLLYA
jgi:hypothetical protein